MVAKDGVVIINGTADEVLAEVVSRYAPGERLVWAYMIDDDSTNEDLLVYQGPGDPHAPTWDRIQDWTVEIGPIACVAPWSLGIYCDVTFERINRVRWDDVYDPSEEEEDEGNAA